ncbi:isocitrate lyase/phosphoenolpyruvate mutase family protein [uncultured Tistrella sp.]|uniref:isocitrate lyase/phosphoenolpyruvate mutase family protein n=1 Tax=Tistrella mobilis TaxID=171437 RepID=UPI000C0980EE|nr:isocitrate lyase/phosphoenolpyruvate mutase family protein [uncultured Tistrella sp.]MAM74537.1 phosphoenolpyruvate phosphomutase [Tistrella sp.]
MTSTRRAFRDRVSGATDAMPARIMAAHNPLSARLVEEAGFDGVWASGFEISAALGLPDISLVSMAEHLEVVRAMAARTRLPVVADIDTGFGNAVNVLHAVRSYEAAGAAGVVIEDKVFPKVTSLVEGGRQDLLRIAEFQGKIEAARHARNDPDFLIIARTEALIAGAGPDAALERGRAYAAAGADLLLVHSKSTTPDEIEDFIAAWDGGIPIVIVPTAYPQMTMARAGASGRVGLVIYGNHAIRAAVAAMQESFARIIADGDTLGVEPRIAPVGEIFRLQGMDQVTRDEAAFLR